MAKITITVTDSNLEERSYKVDFAAEGSQIEEGRATAAYFTGYFLHSLVNDDDFILGATQFGRMLVENMEEANGGTCPMPTLPASARLVLTDLDLETGRYKPELEFISGDRSGEQLPTAAQVIAIFMRSLLQKMEFQKACWDFADDLIRDNDLAQIINPDFAPAENDTGGNKAA